MTPETKTCQNCKNRFTIESDDFNFYDRLRVPPPTWCPECRTARRAVFRNERNFYRRQCGLCKKDVISIYSVSAPFPIYCQECYWSDHWDPLFYGQEYDFSKPFFEQWKKLSDKVPRIALINRNSLNTHYSHLSTNNKNCYFLVESSYNENLQHGYWMQHCKDSVDNAYGTRVELCYETNAAFDSFKVRYSYPAIYNCSESWFLKYCFDCHNCFGCINIRHKKYCIFNKQLTKEEYEETLNSFNLITRTGIEKAAKKVEAFYLTQPRRFVDIINGVNSTGNYMTDVRNCRHCFFAYQAENCKYSLHILNNIHDVYDVDTAGENAELLYEDLNIALSVYRVTFTNRCWTGHNVCYSEYIDNCHDVFGCISLRQKSYCIFNKQYSESEYERLVSGIKRQMIEIPYRGARGLEYRFGEFFPPEFSPFAYNETVAQLYYPLNKKETIDEGFPWKDYEEKNYRISLLAEKLPDNVRDIPDELTEEVIGCLHKSGCEHQCTSAFKITQAEVQFYKIMNLPLPRLCPNCRHEERLKWLNPLQLWHRKCQCAGEQSENAVYQNQTSHFHGVNHCPNEFETAYAPERPEIVYCEKCYNIEVV